jgi:hypothetical protein
MPQTSPLPITQGRKTTVTLALLSDGVRTEPVAATLTLTSAPSKGATTLALTATTPGTTNAVNTNIYSGQYLQFTDSSSRLYIAQVNANYTGGTSMTVLSLPEAITNGSTAPFPAKLNLRTAADISFSTDTSDVDTYDHSLGGDAAIGSTTAEIDLSGEYSAYDAGYNTAAYAQSNGKEVYITRTLATPGSAFATGKVTKGASIITSREEPAPVDGNVSANMTARLIGPSEVAPVATT